MTTYPNIVKGNGIPAKEGDLQTWIIPQIPGKPFIVDVDSIAEGRKILDALSDFQLFMLAQNVMPDYSNVGGIRRFEYAFDGGFDWCDVDDDEEDALQGLIGYCDALREVLDSLGALGGSWWELVGHGFTEARAQEIVALVDHKGAS